MKEVNGGLRVSPSSLSPPDRTNFLQKMSIADAFPCTRLSSFQGGKISMLPLFFKSIGEVEFHVQEEEES